MLTIEEQIAIYKEAKLYYFDYSDHRHLGMCEALSVVLRNKGIFVGLFTFSKLLPTFTPQNVSDLSIKDKFQSPNIERPLEYWWDVKNHKVRLEAFDSLIKQLEIKL